MNEQPAASEIIRAEPDGTNWRMVYQTPAVTVWQELQTGEIGMEYTREFVDAYKASDPFSGVRDVVSK
jgi:hypothetical protein